MKKILGVLLVLLISFVTISCGCNKKITLSEECYLEGDGQVLEIEYSDLAKLSEDKKTFVLYVYEATCSSCARFTPIVNEYVKDAHLLIYKIKVQDLSNNKSWKSELKATPGIFIFKDGELKITYDGLSEGSGDVFSTKDGWKNWVENQIVVK